MPDGWADAFNQFKYDYCWEDVTHDYDENQLYAWYRYSKSFYALYSKQNYKNERFLTALELFISACESAYYDLQFKNDPKLQAQQDFEDYMVELARQGQY